MELRSEPFQDYYLPLECNRKGILKASRLLLSLLFLSLFYLDSAQEKKSSTSVGLRAHVSPQWSLLLSEVLEFYVHVEDGKKKGQEGGGGRVRNSK